MNNCHYCGKMGEDLIKCLETEKFFHIDCLKRNKEDLFKECPAMYAIEYGLDEYIFKKYQKH